MENKPGIYRVVYSLPGSLGSFKQQFIYTTFMEDSVKDIAKNRSIVKDSKRYNVKESKINILNIEFIRPISKNQKTLKNTDLFDN
jgi:hypothetical protein